MLAERWRRQPHFRWRARKPYHGRQRLNRADIVAALLEQDVAGGDLRMRDRFAHRPHAAKRHVLRLQTTAELVHGEALKRLFERLLQRSTVGDPFGVGLEAR